MMRVGIGYDIHKLIKSNKLSFKLSGISIPFCKRCVAHSDGDVAIHALIDALLGAAALGDIGAHFPDTDHKYKNADSIKLLEEIVTKTKKHGYSLQNVSIIIHLEEPKLAKYVPAMKQLLAQALGITENRVGITCTTHEGLGFIGQKEGIAVSTSTLLYTVEN
jgi:2-C-methyl-D-erythritol 2,4-cyclodiphosphate synthase